VTSHPPTLRVDPADEARLAAQARTLADDGTAGVDQGRDALQVVTFRIGGQPCAAPAHAVERAVARLGATTDVPQAGGGVRTVAWVDEQPVAVTDLAALAGLAPRAPAMLALGPALLLATPAGVAALAVEGPLELAEAPLAQVADPALAELPGLGLAGRLAGGAALLSADWLRARAGGGGWP
jgi:chemotaxis signal transduction protein